MGNRWREFSKILKRFLVTDRESGEATRPRAIARKIWSASDEEFSLENRSDCSVLNGLFRVHGEIVTLSHSQWEEDSHPMTLSQRKQILRKTIEERLKRGEWKRSSISSR